MAILKALTAAAFVVVTAACASQKAPAQAAVATLESAVTAAKPEIDRYAPDQWPALNASVTAVQAKMAAGDYAGVLADAPAVNARLTEATTAAATKKAALTEEWESMASIPAMVQQVAQRVAELSGSRTLPKGIDRAMLAGAQGTIARSMGLMGEASQALEAGDMAVAVAKAKEIKAAVEPLLSSFGLAPAGM